MTAPRDALGVRLTRGWEQGFGRGARGVLGLAGGGYRGLLGVRDWCYARGVLRSRRLPCPVVSIGNLTVGGTGKTPAVEIAIETLVALGRRPAVVSRGYGRRTSGVRVVADAASIRLDAAEAGDEPFLLARRLPGVPVLVGSHRYAAARAAIDRFGVTAIVLDDGFQHRTLHKDLEIVMARAHRPWGNGRLLPGGPLREPLAALRRAHLVVAAGVGAAEEAAAVLEAGEVLEAVRRWAPEVPVLAATYTAAECWEAARMRPVSLPALRGRRLLAFAGIASPGAFGATLADLGVEVARFETFADHHWYGRAELAALEARAVAAGADALITTEKDWVRLRALPPTQQSLYVLSVSLRLRSGEAVWRAAFERACTSG